MMKIGVCLLLGFSLWACKTKTPESHKATNQGSLPTAAELEASENSPILVVSFFSIAYGIDHQAKKALDGYLAKEGSALQVEIKPWGREGEIDYCLYGKGLTAAEKALHIQAIRELLAAAKNLHLRTNTTCRETPPLQNNRPKE